MYSTALRAIAGAVALLFLQAPAATAQTTTPLPATLSLNGVGEIAARPDMAHVTAGVVSDAETARDAMTANNDAMAKVIAALKDADIEAKDIQTSGFSVQPQYSYPQPSNGRQEPPRIVGYQVSNQVSVRVRDLANLGTTLDQLVSSGANQINGIAFGIDDDEKLLDDARGLAVKDAVRKAQLYSAAANVRLVRILTIQESGGLMPQQPMPFNARMMKAEAASAAPIETGEQAMRIEVNITWEIAPAS